MALDDFAEETQSAEKSESKKQRKWPLVTGATLLVLAGLYGGGAYFLGDKIPSGTTVAGVPVGGMTKVEAQDAISAELASAVTEPRTVALADNAANSEIDPADIGLAVDYDATLDKLTGFSLDPRRMIEHLSGGDNYPAELTADDAMLTAKVAEVADEFKKDPVNAEISLNGTDAVVTPSENGITVNTEESEKVILSQWLDTSGAIVLPQEDIAPELTTEDMKGYVDDTVNPLLSGPVSVTVKDKLVEISPQQMASLISFEKNDAGAATDAGTPSDSASAEGETTEGATDEASEDAVNPALPTIVIDEKKLDKLVADKVGDSLSKGRDASIEVVDGTTPKITPSKDGESVDSAALAKSLAGIAGSTDRTVVAEIKTKPAEFTTEDAEKMGIKEVVSEISTPLTNDPVRTTNLLVGCQKVNNTLVKPGEQFNLEKELGPITEENGFVSSGVVANGFNSNALGGGLSQLSTNTFNIGYRAGMIDVAHQPHSKYFDRYPMGLEATLWSEQIPMIWENNTPYGALVESWVEDGQVHTRLWSTKYWDVEVWQGEPFGYIAPEVKHNPAHDCVPMGAGASGFSVRVGRTVKLNGEVKAEDEYTWTYQPVHAVRCD